MGDRTSPLAVCALFTWCTIGVLDMGALELVHGEGGSVPGSLDEARLIMASACNGSCDGAVSERLHRTTSPCRTGVA